MFRREKEEPIHWFNRSPENTRSISQGWSAAFSARVLRHSSCIFFSACSQVFCPSRVSVNTLSKLVRRGPSDSFFPAMLAQVAITGLVVNKKLLFPRLNFAIE